MPHDLCNRDGDFSVSFLMEHGFKFSTSQENCTSVTSAVIAVCAIWLSGIVFLFSCVVGLIWYIKKLSDSQKPGITDEGTSEDFDIVDSRRERLDLEQGLLSCGGRESRKSSVDLNREGWEPVEVM